MNPLKKHQDEGMNFEIGSHAPVEQEHEKAKEMRRPLQDTEVKGTVSEHKTRPYKIDKTVEGIEKLDDRIDDAEQWKWNFKKSISFYYRTIIPKVFCILALIVADGMALGPVVANAIGSTGSSELSITVLGLGISAVFAFWSLIFGSCIRRITKSKAGQSIAVFLNAILGLLAGCGLGYVGGGGKLASTLIRGILTAFAMGAASGIHFEIIELLEVVTPIKNVNKYIKKLTRKRKGLLNYINDYQNKSISKEEFFNHREFYDRRGMLIGKHGYEEQGVRNSFVFKRVGSWFDKLFAVLLIPTIISFNFGFDNPPPQTTIAVFDYTLSIQSQKELSERALEEVQPSFGDSTEIFGFTCTGLTPIYQAHVPNRTKAGHRQTLEKIHQELKRTVNNYKVEEEDKKCSPLIASLKNLGEEVKIRVEQGEKIRLVVASDFISNNDPTKIEGQPFKGVEVVVVMSKTAGRNHGERIKALKLAKKVFQGSTLRFVF